jgi:hypothetical protein
MGELIMEEFFKEIVERAHYYEKFEAFREYKEYEQMFQMESKWEE